MTRVLISRDLRNSLYWIDCKPLWSVAWISAVFTPCLLFHPIFLIMLLAEDEGTRTRDTRYSARGTCGLSLFCRWCHFQVILMLGFN